VAVTDFTWADAHVGEEQIGLHFLGELDPERSDAVHRHLQSCRRCGAKGEEVVETLAALALGADHDPAVPRPDDGPSGS
jgi:anti-sigma factor RsiW